MTDSEVSARRHCLYSVLASGILAVSIVIATFIWEDAFWASKAITVLVMPTGLVWLFLFSCGVGFSLRRNRPLGWLFFVVWILFGATFNERIGNWLIQSIEHPGTQVAESDDPLRAVLVLGGGAFLNRLGSGELNRDGERVLSA
ncbi:MAG: hypothetical protein HKN47_19265, partial [Pirellulaceae bacterium]|nr:hypothetical protein [Pirellulaceae bacterium]